MNKNTKLRFTHQITERRDFGKKVINQEMEVVVDYDPGEDSFDVCEVNISENGKYVAEISKLLDKAEGDPLLTMIEAIDWKQIYYETIAEMNDYKCDECNGTGIVEKSIPSGEDNLEADVEAYCSECDGSGKLEGEDVKELQG